jgi:hypothetical protein
MEQSPETDAVRPDGPPSAGPKVLTPAAARALAEAAERRAEQQKREQDLAAGRELQGRGGLDPVRYNDWEIKGLTADF